MSLVKKTNITSAVILFVMVLSWVLNFGYLRMLLSVCFYPVFSGGLFFLGNYLCARYAPKRRYFKVLLTLSYVTYLVPFLFISDGDDANTYTFFGLIKGEAFPQISTPVSYFFMAVYTGVLIAQFVCFFAVRKKDKQKDERETVEKN